ncbi:YceK/YidQ family lipoprotein [Biostraticola tofi]|uniref:Uncharacterized protein YceK n=1 Tax=Biostraticola tofi TaxID=466109 RepID=A0A4R3YSM3_9GAMM|nr:YceK/YidQ family lipoprotein [Biostraticola tofi]TCV95491.1 uncharacterized protein YceK [Biostraticola tofi]
MFKNSLFFLAAAFALLGGSGCSSIMTHTGNHQGYYPGTRAAMDMLRDDETPWNMIPLASIDLPFSAVLDTLLLPYDYYHQDSDATANRDRLLHQETSHYADR